MTKVNPKDIITARNKLNGSRNLFTSAWDDAARYCLPAQDEVGGTTTSDQAPADSAGVRSASVLASGLFSNAVTSGQRWFALQATDEKLNDDSAVSEWLTETTQRIHKAIVASNFSVKIHETLVDYVIYGTACLYVEMSDLGELTFRTYQVPSGVGIAENAEGRVDTLYRTFKLSAKQAVQKFGGEVSDKIQKAVASPSRMHEEFEFIHAVYPDIQLTKGKLKKVKDRPFISAYVEVDERHLVRQGGYEQFPFQVPRFWKVGDECYGRSPAMAALGDLRMLCRASLDILDATEMAISPPTFLPAGSDDPKLVPGAVNFYNPSDGGKPFFYPAGAVQIAPEFLERYHEAIRELFYADLFMMLEQRKNMTATEVQERINEKIQSISPVVSRLQEELFALMIERVVSLMADAGQLPAAPPMLAEKGYAVNYTSRLDSRLKHYEVTVLTEAIGIAAQLTQAVGEAGPVELQALYKIRKVLRDIALSLGVDVDLLRSEQESDDFMKQVQDVRKQQQEQAMVAEKVKPIDVQKPIESGSPLEAMAGTVQQ